LNLVSDSDFLVFALHKPSDPNLLINHEKAVLLFKSFINGFNSSYLTSTVAIEVASVLSKLINLDYAKSALDELYSVTKEIYPFSSRVTDNHIFSTTSNFYFSICQENALKLSKFDKDEADNWVPGWKKSKTETMVSGMDIFILSYAQLKDAALITNDWSLWYAAWKSGLRAYWLSGLTIEDAEKISNGEIIEYPKTNLRR